MTDSAARILRNQTRILENQERIMGLPDHHYVPSRLSAELKSLNRIESDIANLQHAVASLRQEISSHNGGHETLSFPQFKRLPLELQRNVWRMACFSDPYVLRVHARTWNVPGPDPLPFCCTGYRVPAVLHTTMESRKEALKWYQKVAINLSNELSSEDKPQVYINFDVDVLFPIIDRAWIDTFATYAHMPHDIPDDRVVEVVTKHRTLRKFRRIAIVMEQYEPHLEDYWIQYAKSFFKPRCKIEEFLVVDADESFVDPANEVFGRDHLLYPLNEDDFVKQWTIGNTSSKVNVKRMRDRIYSCFEPKWTNGDDDGELQEDEPSDEEDTGLVKSTATAVSDASGNHKAGISMEEPRKPLPKLRFMKMAKQHPTLQPTIRMA